MWSIDKRFDFCYGHRVHCQILNDEYTEKGHTKAKCRHLHGHQGHAHIFLDASKLNKQGMVVDFTWLGWLKDFIDEYIDHKFILDLNDPWFDNIVSGYHGNLDYIIYNGDQRIVGSKPHLFIRDNINLEFTEVYVPNTHYKAGSILDTSQLSGDEKDFYDSFFFVDFIPTSENLSEWLFNCVDAKMSLIDVETTEVQWFETPKSRSSFKKHK